MRTPDPGPDRRREAAPTFEQFVLARGGALWRTAWLLTGDRHLAEDLVQTALAKAHRAFTRVGAGDPGAFEAYVRRIVFTTYLGWRTRRSFAERPLGPAPDRAAPGSVEADVVLHRDLVAALGRLPRGQRAVVVLRHVEDLTEAQTAQVLGVSVGTVKSQNARALAALRASSALAGLGPTSGGEE